MPTIKLIEIKKGPALGQYEVMGLVDTVSWNIGQYLTKAEVKALIDAGTYKVVIK